MRRGGMSISPYSLHIHHARNPWRGDKKSSRSGSGPLESLQNKMGNALGYWLPRRSDREDLGWCFEAKAVIALSPIYQSQTITYMPDVSSGTACQTST